MLPLGIFNSPLNIQLIGPQRGLERKQIGERLRGNENERDKQKKKEKERGRKIKRVKTRRTRGRESESVRVKQNRFTTCFKTCGTGSLTYRGWGWVQSPFDAPANQTDRQDW